MVKQLCMTIFGVGWAVGLIVIGVIFIQNATLCTSRVDVAFSIAMATLTGLTILFGLWGITKGWIFPTRGKDTSQSGG